MKTGTFVIKICAGIIFAVLLPGYMLRTKNIPAFFSQHADAWLFAGLLPWLLILRKPDPDWEAYGRQLLLLFLLLLPVLVFGWYRQRWLRQFSRKGYITCWLICFGGALPLTTFIFFRLQPPGLEGFFPVSCAMAALILELLLTANASYRLQVQRIPLLQKISLENAVFITIALISLTLAVMGVSSLHDPRYHTPEQLLIGFEFSIIKILRYFGTFLSFFVQFLLMYLCGYLFFYINSRFLVLKVLKQKGVLWYILAAFAAVAVCYPLIAQLLISLPVNHLLGTIFPDNPFKLENAFAALGILLFSLPVILAVQWTRQNSRILQLEKEKAGTELYLLKQQLNPHFFFNTLNNLYALSLQQSPQTPESILQLSDLMRYVIYKGQEPLVGIGEEVKYLEDYIQLQQIRLKKTPDLRFTQNITDPALQIPPMLLIVFIENAFKHGIEPAEENAFLHIHLQCEIGQLYFSCENSFEPQAPAAPGIGLSNLQKRLALLYPGSHLLQTGVKNHTFKAELQLNRL